MDHFEWLRKTKRRNECGGCWKNSISNFLLRIIIVGTLLSLLWGCTVYFYATRLLQAELFRQLDEVGETLVNGAIVSFNEIDPRAVDHLIDAFGRLRKDFGIISLDLYDTGHKSVYHYENESKAFETYRLKTAASLSMPSGDRDEYSIYKFGDEMYCRFFRPIYKSGKFLGSVDIMVVLSQKVAGYFKKALILAMTHTAGTIFTMALVLYPLVHASYRKLRRSSRDLLESNLSIIKALGNAIAERDSNTDEHNYRVTYFSLCLADRLSLPAPSVRALMKGAFLHDVGKIGICDDILRKPSSLSFNEFMMMKTHVQKGAMMVRGIPWLQDAIDVIRFHHERYDGSGYPMGIAGMEIPLIARIFAVADVFDALISDRSYKHALPYGNAIEILRQTSSQFDPTVLARFMQISKQLFHDASTMQKRELEYYLSERLDRLFLRP